MAAQKEVKVKVATDTELQSVEALESKIQSLKKQKLDLKIQTNQNEIANIDEQIAKLKNEIKSLSSTELDVRTNTNEINKLVGDIEKLEGKKVDLNLDIEKSKLDSVKSEVENLDGTTIDVDVNNISAMEAVDQIGQGFDRLKQGLSELADAINEVQQAGMQSEQNKAFLTMNLGADKAKQTYQDISDIVASMPGDDNTMRSVLSTAQALGNNLNADEMRAAAGTMADYMSGSATMGKMALESQQDIMKYLLDGNTAELERGSIVSSQVDKLKEATTFQERQAAMQQVLNDLGYGNISQQDTMLNKQAEWEGMIYNSQDALSSMWLGAEKGAMDYILKLNEATGGLVGMGIALGSFASPLTDTLMGLGQMATGMKAIKDLGFIKWLKDLEIATKLVEAAQWLLNAAEQAFNFILIENPIIAIVMAIMILIGVLIWAYYNVDWFREMVDNAFASLVQIGQIIYSYVAPVIQWLSDLFNSFTSQLGLNTNDWIQAILGFILFLPTLPLQVGIALVNALAKAFGFKGNFVQTLRNTAVSAVQGFANAIMGIPQAVQRCLNWAYNLIMSHPIVQAAIWLGQAIANGFSALGLGQNSPGKIVKAMKQELDWTSDVIQDSALIADSASLGQSISSNFNPNLSWNNLNDARGINPAPNGGDFIINVYGDVDSEKRVREIVEAVRRELSFNNATAGRTV